MVTHPLDSLKVRMYLYGEGQANKRPRFIIAQEILKAEGYRAFLSGMTATCMRQSIFSSVRFATHDHIESQFQAWNAADSKCSTSSSTNLPQKLVSGGLAGALAGGVACPADVVLVRMQADGNLPAHLKRGYRNVLHGLYCIVTQEGLTSLFRGLGPLLTRACCSTAAQFTAYEVAKTCLVESLQMDVASVSTHMLASTGAAGVATLVCNPLDVVKARMMQTRQNGYRNSLHCFTTMIRTEGLGGLYKGLGPNFMRNCPQVVLMWVFYEQYAEAYKLGKRWYNGPPPAKPHAPS
uniref:Mitochondrial carrier protein n=1 Tax=Eutreptiella gymnastica TaxID=73025 RepID=A0A7S4FPL8_9EUGL